MVLLVIVALPLGLSVAIYLSEYASHRARKVLKPVLEILAGIPTVVYGFFAALTVAPFIRGWGESLGLTVASESALAAGLVMGIMIIPFVSSLSDDVINAVPQAMRDGSYGLGATKSETIKQVIIPAALPGILSVLHTWNGRLGYHPHVHMLITGGGITENIPRVLPDGVAVEIDTSTWQPGPVFDFLQAHGNIETAEMRRTFNCGVGMVAVVASADAGRAIETLAAAGESAWQIGQVVPGSRDVKFV